jgi:hypothetical protein
MKKGGWILDYLYLLPHGFDSNSLSAFIAFASIFIFIFSGFFKNSPHTTHTPKEATYAFYVAAARASQPSARQYKAHSRAHSKQQSTQHTAHSSQHTAAGGQTCCRLGKV